MEEGRNEKKREFFSQSKREFLIDREDRKPRGKNEMTFFFENMNEN